ncbi:MarR family winged helix-turn-helix transcriptional regulator [Streptococcus oriscaviae]|uniref:MarR family transcriptional regulator n=1 Tax=Streptococcus oriscaviae TaxID=2781599 RepID=A0ABX7YMH3_9STRE|nr:MarR family transcriptional regulator [Streptococcus oriscaviae]QUE55033.1 MarR family transcriptional regulator [Streptococcus oriscaviae]
MKNIANLLYQLKLAEERITTLFEKQLGISLTRYQLLTILLDDAPCSQHVLEEKLQIDRAAITRHLKILEEEGYISRQRNPRNQREMEVVPTSKAISDMVSHPQEQHLLVRKAMEAILTEEEGAILSQLLEKLQVGVQNLPLNI